MVTIRALLLGVAVVGCSSPATAPGALAPPTDAVVRVVNATGEPLAFFAIAADLAPLLDPVPEASVRESWVHVVPAGADQAVGELSGREEAPDGGVAVYLYALTDAGARVHFTRVHLASGQEIRRAGGRIVIRDLRS